MVKLASSSIPTIRCCGKTLVMTSQKALWSLVALLFWSVIRLHHQHFFANSSIAKMQFSLSHTKTSSLSLQRLRK